MGKGGNLGGQGPAARGFVFPIAALFFDYGTKTLDLKDLFTDKGSVLDVARIVLLTQSFDRSLEPTIAELAYRNPNHG